MTDVTQNLAPTVQDTATEEVPSHRHAQEALARNKQQGMDLAFRARTIALLITAALLVFLNPNWDVLWYQGLLLLLILVGYLQRRVGRVGQSRVELLLIFMDLSLMTLALLVPNPLSRNVVPTSLIYQFDVFQYFYIILATGVLSYSWRTIVAIGNWTLALWMIGALSIWYFGYTVPGLSETALGLFPENAELSQQLDPNYVHWDLRIQEVVVFIIVAGILAVTVRRYQNLVLDSAEMSRERTNLARYFSPTMVEELSQKDEPLGQIRSHDAAVLFVDIVGFTAFSDGRPPQDVIETLRAFHARMESEVFAHGGTLDKYLGDGLMATFGTPLPLPDDAARAVACVRAMVDRMAALNISRKADGLPVIEARFGLHFGPVVLGDIGANRLEFAVLGDTVNVASRMEAMTRALKVQAIVSDAVIKAAGTDEGFAHIPDQDVRGLAAPLAVWVIP